MTGHIHRKTLIVGLALMAVCVIGVLIATWPFESASKLAVIAAAFRGALIVCVFSLVFGFGPRLTYFQRACLGLSGAAMTMTIQSLLIENTPYELWATILSSFGFLGFFGTLGAKDLWERIASLAGEKID